MGVGGGGCKGEPPVDPGQASGKQKGGKPLATREKGTWNWGRLLRKAPVHYAYIYIYMYIYIYIYQWPAQTNLAVHPSACAVSARITRGETRA